MLPFFTHDIPGDSPATCCCTATTPSTAPAARRANTATGAPSTPGKARTPATTPAPSSTSPMCSPTARCAPTSATSRCTSAPTSPTPSGEYFTATGDESHLARRRRGGGVRVRPLLPVVHLLQPGQAPLRNPGCHRPGRIPRARPQQRLHQLDGGPHLRPVPAHRRPASQTPSRGVPGARRTNWFREGSGDDPQGPPEAFSAGARSAHLASSPSSTATSNWTTFLWPSCWNEGSDPREYLGGGNGLADHHANHQTGRRGPGAVPLTGTVPAGDHLRQLGVLRAAHRTRFELERLLVSRSPPRPSERSIRLTATS